MTGIARELHDLGINISLSAVAYHFTWHSIYLVIHSGGLYCSNEIVEQAMNYSGEHGGR